MILRALTVIFVAQLALVATLYWPADSTPKHQQSLLTTISQDTVERIELSNGDGATLVLLRNSDGWRLDLGLPVDEAKVALLLKALTASDPGFPIADSGTAAARFEVSEAMFQRKITLSSSDREAIAYLGSTPALRKIHARAEGENAVFVIAFSRTDAPVDIDSWLDPRLLSPQAPAAFSLYGTEFTLDGGRWSRSDDEPVDQMLAAAFAETLGSVQVSGLVDAADDDAASAEEALRASIGIGAQGSQVTVLHNPNSDRYYLQSKKYGAVFSTSAYDAERLIEAAPALMQAGG